MEVFMEYWLSIVVGVCLLSMVLYGHYKGFLRLAVTFSALIISLLVVQAALPRVTGYLQEHTEIHKMIGENLLKVVGTDSFRSDDIQILPELQTPAQQRALIEQLNVPEQLKQVLLENNNREIYRRLNVDKFVDYVESALAGVVLNLVGSVVLFLVVYIGLRILIRWLDLLAKLPILNGINQIAGAVLGGVQGLLLLWLFFLIVQLCTGCAWTQAIRAQILKSVWLEFLYDNNLLSAVIMGVLKHIV